MCIRIVSIQNGCVTCHLFCWLLVNVYKYAIKHFNSVFFSLCRIFDIVQYSVDAVYIAEALFEDRLGLDAGQVCPQTLHFKVWVVPGRSNWEKVVLGEGIWELWEEEEWEVCLDCDPQAFQFTLWLISEVPCHWGEFQRQLSGPSHVSVAAAGKVLKEGTAREGSWEQGQKDVCSEDNAFFSYQQSPHTWWVGSQLEESALGEQGQRNHHT